MALSVFDGTQKNPGINHTDARYVNITFTNGSTTVTTNGHPEKFPDLTLQTAATVSGGTLIIPVGGNRTTRVYLNQYIDNLMRLDLLPSATKYKCKFFATKIQRHLNTTDNTNNERLFQYGDQGTGGAGGTTGGWVARINNGTSAPDGALQFAMHTEYNPLITKPGAQGDAIHPDPIALTPIAYSNAQWEAGLSIVCAVDMTVPRQVTSSIYIDGSLVATDTKVITSWAIPGISTNGPGNNSTSNGFVLFNQSVNQDSSLLLDSTVWPIWFGEAQNAAQLASIASKLYADPFANPYSRS